MIFSGTDAEGRAVWGMVGYTIALRAPPRKKPHAILTGQRSNWRLQGDCQFLSPGWVGWLAASLMTSGSSFASRISHAARRAPRAANALADDVGLQLRLPHLARSQACASRGQGPGG